MPSSGDDGTRAQARPTRQLRDPAARRSATFRSTLEPLAGAQPARDLLRHRRPATGAARGHAALPDRRGGRPALDAEAAGRGQRRDPRARTRSTSPASAASRRRRARIAGHRLHPARAARGGRDAPHAAARGCAWSKRRCADAPSWPTTRSRSSRAGGSCRASASWRSRPCVDDVDARRPGRAARARRRDRRRADPEGRPRPRIAGDRAARRRAASSWPGAANTGRCPVGRDRRCARATGAATIRWRASAMRRASTRCASRSAACAATCGRWRRGRSVWRARDRAAAAPDWRSAGRGARPRRADRAPARPGRAACGPWRPLFEGLEARRRRAREAMRAALDDPSLPGAHRRALAAAITPAGSGRAPMRPPPKRCRELAMAAWRKLERRADDAGAGDARTRTSIARGSRPSERATPRSWQRGSWTRSGPTRRRRMSHSSWPRLQDRLGALQDAAVAEAAIRGTLDGRGVDARYAFEAGRLVERQRTRAGEARAGFLDVLAEGAGDDDGASGRRDGVPIRAGGGVVWRRMRRPDRRAGVEVAIIHRPRYDDWSLPKGKLADRRVRPGGRRARGARGDRLPRPRRPAAGRDALRQVDGAGRPPEGRALVGDAGRGRRLLADARGR